ncbi:ABC transporter permease [Leifsonia sp. McL0607]|uniref:ABC transporter permease n=1 Tax=Leifsonia sp. McL0607 TaxID=3415672 RepID=UPI003CF99142
MPRDVIAPAGRPSTVWRDAWHDMRRRPVFWVAATLLLLVVVMAVSPGLFAHVAPNDGCRLGDSNGDPTVGHPLGFTKQGCDVYARIVHGAGTSLTVGVVATAVTAAVGTLFGACAGFFGGWADAVLSRLGDIAFSIPSVLAAVVVMSVLASSANVWVVSLAIGTFAWPVTARVLRAETLRVKTAEYVLAAEALGSSRRRILLGHVLPNALPPVLVVITQSFAGAIVAEATLSFLGIGLPSDVMSWGNDIGQAQRDLRTAPHTLVFPSLALSSTVLSLVVLGEVIRDALDPRAGAPR